MSRSMCMEAAFEYSMTLKETKHIPFTTVCEPHALPSKRKHV